MRQRNQPIDLSNGSGFMMTAAGEVADLFFVGFDVNGEPIYVCDWRLYARNGDLLGQRPQPGLLPHDLVADAADPVAAVPTEAALHAAVGLALAEVHAVYAELPMGVELTRNHLASVIDQFLVQHPRFERFRPMLLRAGACWTSAS
ncbi:MAG: hypothetical protein H0X45_00395 [Planctomycetes bacterium]|nr:hypothetical protein [Planctomycetota bacterium]